MRRRMACCLIEIGILLIMVGIAAITSAVHLENQDEFCATCHTEPESTYYQRTLADSPTDLASAHASYKESVRCIDCHSTAGIEGRVNALWQGVQDVFAYVIDNYNDPAITESPLGDNPCLKCHTMPSRDNPIGDQNLIYSNSHYHWVEYIEAWLEVVPNRHGTCAACHLSHSENTLAVLGFRHMPTVNAACDMCHTTLSGTIP